jgi:hypothetical protein
VEGAEGAAAVADRVFFVWGQLGHGSAGGLVGQEQGVVAEAVDASRRRRDRTFDGALGGAYSGRADEGDGTPEPRAAVDGVREGREQRAVVRIGRRLGGEPAAVHARSAAECVHLEPAVVREAGEAGLLVAERRLLDGVREERVTGLGRLGVDARVRQQDEVEPRPTENRADLVELVQVRRRDDDRGGRGGYSDSAWAETSAIS